MMSLMDVVIIFLSRLVWYLIFYGFSLVIFVGFVGGIILSFFKVFFRVFSDTILFTLSIKLYYIPDDCFNGVQ